MAKKKLTHHHSENGTQKTHHEEPAAFSNLSAMDEASEKLETLKSLNSRLLKETVDRRREVDLLLKSKGSLESELTRSNSENEVLRSELNRLSDGVVKLEVERSVVIVFLSQQAEEVIEREKDEMERKMKGFEREMREILREKGEIEKLKGEKEEEIELLNGKINELMVSVERERDFSNGIGLERDGMRAKLDVQIKEATVLGEKLVGHEEREKSVQKEIGKLRVEYNKVVKEKEDREREIEGMSRDKELVEKSLVEANKAIQKMKREIDETVKQKEEIEDEKNVAMRKTGELEIVVSGLNEIVGSLRNEEESLRLNVAELEKKCIEGEEKEKDMGRKIAELVKEKNERERKLLVLTEEKGVLEKNLDEVLKQLDEVKLKIEQTVTENNEIIEAKDRKEKEIVVLEKLVAELRDAVSVLEDSCKAQKGKIVSLESEVRNQKDSFEQVLIERDEARKGFDEERRKCVSLKKRIEEMEKNVQETVYSIEKMKAENANLRGEKEDLESHCNLLKKDIASTENALADARKNLDAMKAKLEVADANGEQVLKVLRSIAELVGTKDEKNFSGDKEMMNEEVEQHAAELEAIKNAFKSKENKLEDMKRQVESLENSVAEAHKKKSFWTVMSSATTIFAAISLAYIARGH